MTVQSLSPSRRRQAFIRISEPREQFEGKEAQLKHRLQGTLCLIVQAYLDVRERLRDRQRSEQNEAAMVSLRRFFQCMLGPDNAS